ncbi:hypothetical protein NC652_035338 [Populus alba x Populus x berolinensis]|nr:hypothetical protein NC652_035338 [Populus alba x Populus x berolinensis]
MGEPVKQSLLYGGRFAGLNREYSVEYSGNILGNIPSARLRLESGSARREDSAYTARRDSNMARVWLSRLQPRGAWDARGRSGLIFRRRVWATPNSDLADFCGSEFVLMSSTLWNDQNLFWTNLKIRIYPKTLLFSDERGSDTNCVKAAVDRRCEGGWRLRLVAGGWSVVGGWWLVKIDKHAYSTTDIAITYLLFAAAVFLEFYAFLCLVLSDWTLIWLINEGGNALTGAIYFLIRNLTRSQRWSRSISQYNLISSSFESEQPKCLELLGIDEKMRQMHVNRKYLNVELQRLIFRHLQKKSEKMKEDLNFFDKNLRSKIIGQRGDGVLEREGLLRDFKWCTTDIEFSRSILVWHLAADICYRADKDASIEYERSRCLSEYMMYLLVIRPNMLSKGFGDEGCLHDTLRDLRRYNDVVAFILRNSESLGYDDIEFQRRWKTEKSVLRGVERLVRQLLFLGPEKRWEMVNEVWIEMVAYAAAHCPWKEHTHQLRTGGELLTHVSLLMLHLGLSAQYEFNESDYFSHLTEEERQEYEQARGKYLEGIADKSGSSLEEELKELKKIVADAKRELEHKNQELEQLRSSLTASTPHQGID